MATRSPTEFHGYWGTFANAAALPLLDPRLQPGDTAFATAEASLFFYNGTAWIPISSRPKVSTSALTSRTVVDGDNNRIEQCTANTLVTRTIPTGLTVGTTIEFVQSGQGQVQVVPGAGMSLLYPSRYMPWSFDQKATVVATVASANLAIVRGRLADWNPLYIPAIEGIWEADTGVTLAGGNVDSWADQCGNGNLSAASSVVRPTYELTGVGTGPCVVFDGTSRYLRNLARAAFGSDPTAQSIIVIGSCTSAITTGTRVYCTTSADVARVELGANNATNTGFYSTLGSGGASQNTTGVVTSPVMWWGRYAAGTQQVGRNITQEATTATSPTFTGYDGGRVSVGADPAGTAPRQIRVAALYLVRAAISDSDLVALFSRARTKGWLT